MEFVNLEQYNFDVVSKDDTVYTIRIDNDELRRMIARCKVNDGLVTFYGGKYNFDFYKKLDKPDGVHILYPPTVALTQSHECLAVLYLSDY